ncbi:hypothetical protein CIN_04270 [Commensalibacter intestini A911]|uniref:Smf/DprA SLOG domain-containing protein n=1 Tax=Commensalibacter intestini A911 TaxID=1088868 RepID=G6EYA7_9PROT|nr:DNA processing protein DprA [Commensalibacter intestini]EHD14495.1 hypothetical protein CIN_04270 [Commensalibacter intestini A911]
MTNNNFQDIEYQIFAALIQIKGIGYQTLYNFIKNENSLKSILQTNNIDELNKLLGRHINSDFLIGNLWEDCLKNLLKTGQEYIQFLRTKNIQLLLYTDNAFPNFPKNMKNPVFWLFVQGKIENLHNQFILALVGSREYTNIGKFLTETLLYGISNTDKPFVTISGLAAGIDQLVHTLSLYLHIPTIAVLGNGLLQNYPENSHYLRTRILENDGTIISEYFPNSKPTQNSFIHRNRIQAALANVITPLEWKIKSGTAHTVKFAYEMNKKIICVETPICQNYYLAHALANEDAEKRYSAKKYIFPNDINLFIKEIQNNDTITNYPTQMSFKI